MSTKDLIERLNRTQTTTRRSGGGDSGEGGPRNVHPCGGPCYPTTPQD